MKLRIFEERLLLKWQQKEVIDVKNRGEKIILDSPHAVESDLAKKIKEATNQDIPTEEEYPKWEVIRTGSGVKNYKVGDLVLCHVSSGTNLPTKENGKSELYRLINEKDVYGVWDETL
jgi:hypothetical protein